MMLQTQAARKLKLPEQTGENILKTLLSQNENVQKYLKQVLQDVSKLMELIDQCSDYIPPACGNYHQKVFNIIREETGLYLKEFLTSKKDVIDRKCFEKVSQRAQADRNAIKQRTASSVNN